MLVCVAINAFNSLLRLQTSKKHHYMCVSLHLSYAHQLHFTYISTMYNLKIGYFEKLIIVKIDVCLSAFRDIPFWVLSQPFMGYEIVGHTNQHPHWYLHLFQ
jgi:hypothetical protein